MDLIHRRLHFRSKLLLISDDFSEANNTVIAGKALDTGDSWLSVRTTGADPVAIVTNGKAVMRGDTQQWVVSGITGYSNAKITADIILGDTDIFPVLLFARHNGVAYGPGTYYVAAYIDTNTSVRIVQNINNNVSVLATDTNIKLAKSTAYQCTFVVDGATATLTTPLGSLSATVTDNAYTRYGFAIYKGSASTSSAMDTFKVETL